MELEADILKSFRSGIVAIDMPGRVVYLNEIACKILVGCSLKAGENLRQRSGENAFFRVLVEALDLRYLPSRVEVLLPGRDGMHRSIGFTLAELRNNGNRTGICAFFKDLTHVEMAEENRDLNDRLLLLGQMAAGLAHEIRNPIASIGVHCGLLRSRCQGDEKFITSLNHMEREIQKVEYIIRECLNFVRPADLGIRLVPLEGFLERIAEKADKLFPGVNVTFVPEGIAGQAAEMDEGLLEQALNNVVANAAQACEGKGNVTISARITRGFWDIDGDGKEMTSHEVIEEREDFLTITVKDDGVGIPEEVRDKIFVPFFTTKKDGTGIGLSLTQKIVYAHKGVIDILSNPGKGTEFLIKIPMRQSHV